MVTVIPMARCPCCDGQSHAVSSFDGQTRRCARCSVEWLTSRQAYSAQEPGRRYRVRMPPLWMALNRYGGLCWCGRPLQNKRNCGNRLHRHIWNQATARWGGFRYIVYEQDGNACGRCGKKLEWTVSVLSEHVEGIWRNVTRSVEFVCDHIRPIKLGGWCYDESNTQTLCLPCNRAKTARDAADIAAGRKKPIIDWPGLVSGLDIRRAIEERKNMNTTLDMFA